MNATATHDTKRGEDVRARLNALTEMPEEWEASLDAWMAANAGKKKTVRGELAPSSSVEILIYQTLLGAWPANAFEEAGFAERAKGFLVKALREAKEHSSWVAPQEEYERSVQEFLDGILADEQFLRGFLEFQRKLARCGVCNGLSQLLLKIASPGVPDFYQGSELWNFSLVDPDNRRPVDYQRRVALLENLNRRETLDRIGLIRELAKEPERDEMKLFVTSKLLAARRANQELFLRGDYIPLIARGCFADRICAFARVLAQSNHWTIAIASRWTTNLCGWADTELLLPQSCPPTGSFRDTITELFPASWRIADLLREFPVSLFISTK